MVTSLSLARQLHGSDEEEVMREMQSNWMKESGMVYKALEERGMVFEFFKITVKFVETSNKYGGKTYTLGFNTVGPH